MMAGGAWRGHGNVVVALIAVIGCLWANDARGDDYKGAVYEKGPFTSNSWARYQAAFRQYNGPSFYYSLMLGHEWRFGQMEDAFGQGGLDFNLQSGLSFDRWLIAMDFNIGVHSRERTPSRNAATVRRYDIGLHGGYRWQFSLWWQGSVAVSGLTEHCPCKGLINKRP